MNGQNLLIHTETKLAFEKVERKLFKIGYKWIGDSHQIKLEEAQRWTYGNNTVIRVTVDNNLTYGTIDSFSRTYKEPIIPSAHFLKSKFNTSETEFTLYW